MTGTPLDPHRATMTAAKPKGPRQLPDHARPAAWAETYLTSTVGAKVLVALTGTLLVGFLIFHMIGNLKVLFGRDSINAYAYFLKHSLGPYLWIARAGLFAVFVAHVVLALKLKAQTAAARPVPYVALRPAQATLTSRTMLLTGLLIGAFTLFHLAHYTFGWVKEADVGNGMRINYLEMKDPQGRHDVYNMTVAGFRTSWVSVLYLFAQAVLFAHLAHGVQSVIQTLGLKGTRFAPVWVGVGYATAGLIVAGNVAIVVAIWAGVVGPDFSNTLGH
jgi:succinate dehydrogenase / fumarate reductase cytochrome b subunit